VILFRALSVLLSYPREEVRQALPEIADAINASPLIASRERAGLIALVDDLANLDPLDCEERYVEVFDRGRVTSLHLFEHLHGDSRDRGQAMVDLKRHYEHAGYELASSDLPDYLPVVLEYLSCRDLREARDLLSDCAHILRRIGNGLVARRNPYAAALQALLVIAGEKPLAVRPATRSSEERLDQLDRDWFEPPAFEREPPSVLAAIRRRGTPESL
jgi:nitrate reductase delta subunit